MRKLLLLGVAAIALVGCSPSVPVPTFDEQPTIAVSPPAPEPLPVSLPLRIEVPDIGASSSLIQTGIQANKTIETPPVERPGQASWYNLSPRPGAVGPAVILGHVDGRGKQGVFYRLKDLKSGSVVVIEREDGSTARFEVYEVGKFPKKDFPTDRVYGNTDEPELRLITCGGAFGNAQPGHYDDNIIAFAKLTL